MRSNMLNYVLDVKSGQSHCDVSISGVLCFSAFCHLVPHNQMSHERVELFTTER